MNHVKGCKFKTETFFLRGSGGWVMGKRMIVWKRTMTVKLKINIKNKSNNCFKIPKKKEFLRNKHLYAFELQSLKCEIKCLGYKRYEDKERS